MREAIKGILSALVFPHYCPLCGKEWSKGNGWICQECWDKLPEGGKGMWASEPCLINTVFVAFHYGEQTQQLVHQMKFSGRDDIAPKLGRYAAKRFKEWREPENSAAIVPVPLHPTRRRERGYDQNLSIAKGVAEELQIPLRSDLIVRKRNTPPQSRLSDEERLSNLTGAFGSVKNPRDVPKSVLLIDDVIHTGQTVLGCRNALIAIGVKKIEVLAACG